MPQSLVAAVLFALVVVVLLWFALGTQRNIRTGNDILRWLQGGLPRLGKRTTMQWLGSSAVRLNVANAAAPLTEAEVVVVLQPRDLPWLWAWSRGRGRRDFIVLRARLERPPRFELEAGDPAGWTGSDRLGRLDPDAWSHARWGEGVRVAHSRDAAPERVEPLWERLAAASGGVWRLSIRREPPHLEVHVAVPDLAARDPGDVVAAFVALATEVSTPR